MYITHLIHALVRAPHTVALGAAAFRTDLTTSTNDIEAYDAGRELAHRLTRGRYDQAA